MRWSEEAFLSEHFQFTWGSSLAQNTNTTGIDTPAEFFLKITAG